MGSGVQRLNGFDTCDGRAIVLGRTPVSPGAASAQPGDPALTLASILAEQDASGTPARTVVLRLSMRDDAQWATVAVDWLARHGRRVLLRTPVVLAHDLVEIARRWGATVVLELAHGRPDLQRALLGDRAQPTSALLLHAQHLRARDIEVVAGLGPLMPTVHDHGRGRSHVGAAESLMRHVAAADLRDAHLSIGRLGPGRLEALAETMPWADVLALARAFDLPIPVDRGWPEVGASGARMPAAMHAVFFHEMRRQAEACGLRVDHCGCPAQCHLDPERVGDYVPLVTSDLFGLNAS